MKWIYFLQFTILGCTSPEINDINGSGYIKEKTNHKETASSYSENPTLITSVKNHDWLTSWSNFEIRIDSFLLEFEKEIILKWENYTTLNKHLSEYDSLFILSPSNQMAIDLYSYNTLISKENNRIYVEFESSSKVYVLDKQKEIRIQLAFGSAYDMIEEAVWITEEIIVLFGYNLNEDDSKTPFLWFINISTGIEKKYTYNLKYFGARENYFLTKYPTTVLY
jgi:hypothetical protein